MAQQIAEAVKIIITDRKFLSGGIADCKELKKYGLTEDEIFDMQILLRFCLHIQEGYLDTDLHGTMWCWK